MGIELYTLDSCPYCEKVHDVLSEVGVDHETQWVDTLHSKRNEVKRVSRQRGTPMLVDDDRGVTMPESENTLRYVDQMLA